MAITYVNDYRAITSGRTIYGYDPYATYNNGKGAFITYSFETSSDAGLRYGSEFANGFTPLTEGQKANAREAFSAWDNVSGLTFREVPAGLGDVKIGAYNFNLPGSPYSSSQADAFADEAVEDIFLNVAAVGNSLNIFLHEIGHIIGFSHTDIYNYRLSPENDLSSNTVMSYRGARSLVLGPIDIQAVTYRYGVASADGSQVSSLTWDQQNLTLTQVGFETRDIIRGINANDKIDGRGGNDRIESFGGKDEIFGGDGDDEIFAAGAGGHFDGGSGNDKFDLKGDGFQAFGGDGSDVMQLFGQNIFADGGPGSDQLYGWQGTGEIRGGAGSDFFKIQAYDPLKAAGYAGSRHRFFGDDGNDHFSLILSHFEDLSQVSIDGGPGDDLIAIDGSIVFPSGNYIDLSLLLADTQKIKSVERVALTTPRDREFTVIGTPLADNVFLSDRNDVIEGGDGSDTITGGKGVDTAKYAGESSSYTITQISLGGFMISNASGNDILAEVEYAQFSDQTIRLLPGTGTKVDFNAAPSSYMSAIRDFDGNDLGAAASWKLIGSADVNGDGDVDRIYTNQASGRFAEVATAADGMVYFSDHGWAGETRVVGIYIDPLVQSGQVQQGGPNDSQRRFQNDLTIGNIKAVLGAGDYDHNGSQEVYFSLTDGTAYLHAYMHADGNIQYSNYQSQQQVIDYLTQHGWAASTYAGWFG